MLKLKEQVKKKHDLFFQKINCLKSKNAFWCKKKIRQEY